MKKELFLCLDTAKVETAIVKRRLMKKDLIKLADLDAHTWFKACRGEPVRIGTIQKMSKALRCKPEDILKD